MGKSTINGPFYNSYVCLPEGKKRKRFVCFTKNHQDRLQSGPTSGLHMLTNTYGDMTAQIGKTGQFNDK